MHDGDGWTPETILGRAVPAFEPNFLPPTRSGQVFSWDPV
jgi:hypothetical protein